MKNSPQSLVARGVLAALAALLLLVGFSPALAQTETGQIVGTVSDSTNAVIAGADVTVKSVEKQTQRTTTTNEKGQFVVTSLLPDTYDVTITASGFAPSVNRVQLSVGGRISLDNIHLNVQADNTVVDVLAGEGGISINTSNSELSTVVSEKQLKELPTISRDPYALVALSGNVSDGDPGGASGRGVGFNINGARSSGTNVLLDGGDNNDNFASVVGQSVPLDSVQEFSVLTSNYSAEYGRASGGIVNVATKSGTNDIHGTFSEYNRISALASNDFDNNAQGIAKGTFVRNQFGFAAGGPIKKNKMFFFVAGEYTRIRGTSPNIFYVPTPQLLAASSPNTLATFGSQTLLSPIDSVLTVSQVAAQAGSSKSGAFASLPGSLPAFGRVVINLPADSGAGSPGDTYSYNNRFDWNINNNNSLYMRYALTSNDTVLAGGVASPYAGFNPGTEAYNQNALISFTHIFSPKFTSVTKLTYNRFNQGQPLSTAPVSPSFYIAFGTFSLNGQPVALPGYLPNNFGNAIPFGGPQNLTEIQNDATYVLGRHEIRFGGLFSYLRDNRTFGAFQNSVAELGSTPATGLDNLVKGVLSRIRVAIDPNGALPGQLVTLPASSPAFARSNRFRETAFYVQDNFRVNNRLTLNLGLRYEYFGQQHNKDPRLDANFYLGQGSNIYQQVANGQVFRVPDSPEGSFTEKDKNNFAPRVGFAYDVFGNGKTSLRGGYGIGYERNFGNVTFNVIQNPPNYAVVSLTRDLSGKLLPISPSNFGPFAGAGQVKLPPVTLRALDPKLKTAYNQFYSVSIQHQLLNDTLVSVEYAGSLGRDLYSIFFANPLGSDQAVGSGNAALRANPQYNDINLRSNGGFSHYDSVNFKVQTNNLLKTGLSLNVSYTLAHSLDNLSSTFSDGQAGNFGLGFFDPTNPDLDKGDSDFDVRHRIVISGIYEPTFFRNKSGLQKRLLDGFGMSFLFTASTGAPFSIYDSTNAVAKAPRIALVGQVNRAGDARTPTPGASNLFNYIDLTNLAPGQGSIFNPITGLSDYLQTNPSTLSGRNIFRQPGRNNLDLNVYKRFAINERLKVQLRAELYNALNHANLFVVTSTADLAQVPAVQAKFFGRRQVQLAVKLEF